MLHAFASAPEHNNISSHASQGIELPSVVSREHASLPFADVYATADGAAAGSQAEALQEGCAASEMDACPIHDGVACPWEEHEWSFTEVDPLDAYTGMHLLD